MHIVEQIAVAHASCIVFNHLQDPLAGVRCECEEELRLVLHSAQLLADVRTVCDERRYCVIQPPNVACDVIDTEHVDLQDEMRKRGRPVEEPHAHE